MGVMKMKNLALKPRHQDIWEPNQEKTHILIVDDENSVRRFLSRVLCRNGNRCTLAANAVEAREVIGDQRFDLIFCDINMPGESGIDFIRYALTASPETAVIMVSGNDDPKIAEIALDTGAFGYLIKPFKPSEIIINASNALRRRKLEIENRAHRENLEQRVEERNAELHVMVNNLRKAMKGIIQAMSLTVESRDPYTAGHQRRVADLARDIGIEMGFSGERIEGVCMSGLIHDLGKMSVPAEILTKPGRINKMEFGIIKSHPRVGYDILKDIDFPWPIAQMVLQHHERMDGSGYPQGLRGEEILIEARILGVADVVEAMASHRPYRPARGIGVAIEEISKNKGRFYDPDVVDACLMLFKEKGYSLT